MTSSNATELRLAWSEGQPLTLPDAEQVVAELGAAPTPERRVKVELCASNVDIATGSLLTNALRRYAAAHLLEGPTYPCFAAGESCKCSSILPALAAYTNPAATAERVLTDGFMLVPNVQRPSATSVDEFIAFHHRFKTWLHEILNTPLSGEFRQHLTELAYHAVQNVYDHAYRKPFPTGGPTFSHITAHYRASLPIERGDPGLATYAATVTQKAHHGYLDVTVSDDGIGIAARHAQDAHIYWHDPTEERAALASALAPRSSIKIDTLDTTIRGTPGQGMQAIVHAVNRLDAYLTIRTGRYCVRADGLSETGYTIDDVPRGNAPGTVLNALVPLPPTE